MRIVEGRDRVAYVGDFHTYKIAKSDRGLEANVIEASLASEFGEFVVPTIFQGRVNVQPTVSIVELEFRPLWKCFSSIICAKYAGSFAHNFEKPGNLGIHEGRVKFTDAGSHALEAIMMNYPHELAQSLRAITQLNQNGIINR